MSKENGKTAARPSKAIIACRVGEGPVRSNNHQRLRSSDLIKLLMTCHSAAGPDVYRCPVPTAQLISQSHRLGSHVTRHAHSLSIATVAAAAAAAGGRRRGGGALPFRCADGGCRAVTLRAHTYNQSRGQPCVYLFIRLLFFFPPSSQSPPHPSFSPCDSGHGATASPPPPPFPEPLPLPLSHLWCGSSHFLAATSAALTLTRDTHDKLGVEVKVMGCESNAAATPSPTHLPTVHTVDTCTKAA